MLSANVSAKQFQQTDFIEQLKESLQRQTIKPRLFRLELTEGMLLDNICYTSAKMRAVNSIGIFPLDDFRVGFSSLQYLKRLPLDQLKIDRSFVRNRAEGRSDMDIVITIIATAMSLDLEVIAQSVQTNQQRSIQNSHRYFGFQG